VTSTQSFDDFVPFGGWKVNHGVNDGVIYAKQVGGTVKVPLLCGHTAWHALINEFWY